MTSLGFLWDEINNNIVVFLTNKLLYNGFMATLIKQQLCTVRKPVFVYCRQ